MADDAPNNPSGQQGNVWDYVRRRSELDREIQEKFARPVTIMFTDIKGSTTFFDMRGDLEGVTMLQRHNELVVPPIEKEGGRVLQRLGDGLLAVFPGPTQGVRAGIGIQKRLAAFNEGRAEPERIRVRVGLNTGMGLVEESNVFGDAVNVAARVQTLAEPDQILVSDSVYQEASRDLGADLFVGVGPSALKGKLEKVVVHEVVWSPEQARRRALGSVPDGAPPRVLHVEIARTGARLTVASRETSEGTEVLRRQIEETTYDDFTVDESVRRIQAILGGADREGRVSRQHLDDLAAIGQQLWSTLLPATARERLRHSTAAELVLSIDEQLTRIPWELLHDGREFVALRLAVGRVVTGATPLAASRARQALGPLKVAVVTDPRGDLPEALEEGTRLGTYLGDRPEYTVVVNDGAVSRAEFLARFGESDIVHVAGQGEVDAARSAASGLLVADGRITASDLGGLPAGTTVPRLFFFNACEPAAGGSGGRREAAVAAVASAILAAGVKHFVCSVRAVAGSSGFQFSDEFYHELASGRSIGLAVREARRAAARREGKTSLTWASYVLYGDPTARYVAAGATESRVPVVRGGRRRFPLMAAGVAAAAAVAAGVLWLTFGGGTTSARLDDAYTHLASGRFQDATRAFEALLTVRPAEAYEGLALVALRQGDAAGAQRFCADAQKINVQRPGCLLVQGDSLAVQGDLPKATAIYDAVISFAGVPAIPKSIAYNRLGRLSAAQGQPDKASAAYAKAQEADPSNAEAMSNAGALLRGQGKYAEAIAAFEKAAALSPGDALVQTLLKDTHDAARLGKDQDRQKRVDGLVDELASRFKRGDVVQSVAGRDEWTSPPLTISLLGLESRGRVAFREGEHEFLVLKIGQLLEAQTRARLVDRAVIDKLLAELKLGSSALADPRTALQLGRVLSARVISVGTIAGGGPEWTLTMRLIETESSAVVASVAQSFPATQSSAQVADTVATDLAAKLRRAFPLRARVSGAGKGEVTLNVGSAEGAAVGQKLLILKDSAGVGREAVAEVEIVEVSDHQSRAKVSGQPKPITTGQRAIERT